MYVYIESEPGLWTVGFYSPDGMWNPESDHGTREEAADRVAYLNGSFRAVPYAPNRNRVTCVNMPLLPDTIGKRVKLGKK